MTEGPQLRMSSSLQDQAERILALDLKQIKTYLDDPLIQEVMINDPKNVYVEKSGKFQKVDIDFSSAQLESAITTLCNVNGKSRQRVLDSRLPGLRIAATLPPIAVHGPSMCIRRHSSRLLTLQDYEKQGAFSAMDSQVSESRDRSDLEDNLHRGGEHVSDFLRWLIASEKGFIVTGSTSSGKTAFLNCLAQLLPKDIRILTIEDTQELQIQVPNWVALESNKDHGVDIRTLVRHALRYRPNRIWVGEGRGAEFYDILDAYNTGHAGGAVTFHSNSASMALSRMESMVRMAPEAINWPLLDLRKQIANTFSYVLHCANDAGRRGPSEILAIDGIHEDRYLTRSLFRRVC